MSKIGSKMGKQEKSYGSWKSKITKEHLTQKSIGIAFPKTDGDQLYWLESRPSEKGRTTIVERSEGDILPRDFGVRSKVHEYGGDCYAVSKGSIFFCRDWNQRIYHLQKGKTPIPLTEEGSFRFADLLVDEKRGMLYAVCEEHQSSSVINKIVRIDLKSGEIQTLASGHDFYSSCAISPDHRFFCYLSWNHPNMPWDQTHLHVHEFNKEGMLEDGIVIEDHLSIFQPSFAPDGTLYFVSDQTGFWNLHKFQNGKIQNICPMKAEFGVPQWIFGLRCYGFMENQGSYDIICTYLEKGNAQLALLSLKDYTLQKWNFSFSSYNYLHVHQKFAYFVAGSQSEPKALIALNLENKSTEILKKSQEIELQKGSISMGQSIEFPTEEGKTAHAFFYPPVNSDCIGPDSERPPLIVKVHGGPTGFQPNIFNMEIQFWTSRGVAYAVVNFGGSTGYGREYRERLKNNWGIVDINDCCNCALYLAKEGLVDQDRTAIQGGSSGGYAVLAALTFRDVFQAGVSLYGIADLESLLKETHKFEKHYTDSLIGPYPEKKSLYYERSPIHFTEKIQSPILLMQGQEDKVVLPIQSEKMFQALKKRSIPCAYLLFEGEGHGFRKSDTIEKAVEAQLYFYATIFNFEIEDEIEPIQIKGIK